ncbi:Ribosomal protein L1/ribosomal biogenesis protein [Dillenia turbinata]|uniref:Large ribosomal subunit protein uL1c n=1 Tax=Dillenia turbinata TaxID=194707 RepID=A0AAN8Z7S8_9MAGN
MGTFELLLSQARRHCTISPLRLPPSSLLTFTRSLCSSTSTSSSPSPEQKQETPSNDPQRKQSVPIQVVSYPVKPKDQSASPAAEEEQPKTTTFQRPREPVRPIFQRSDTASERTVESRSWTREDIRYVKDAPSISPVSYPARVAPLPEDRVSSEATQTENLEQQEVKEKVKGEEMEREWKRMEMNARMVRRMQVEEEKVPFPTLIKVEKKQPKVVLDLQEAIRQVKRHPPLHRKFIETVEAHVKLGVDPKRSDQTVRGAATLPHGTGKVVRVAVFAEGAAAEEARAAGADVVGADDLIQEIKRSGGKLNFDKCIATHQLMPRLRDISRILGTRGLMPNPKLGSVTNDVGKAVKEAKQGRVDFKMDKTAIVHVGLGKVDFSEEALRENIGAFVNSLLLAKPVGLKKTSKYAGYVNGFTLCSTMGPGYPVSIQSLSMAADHYNKLHPKVV